MSLRRGHRVRGMILPVMLLILLLLGLLAAGFAFRVHADHSAMNAVSYRLHTRLAAEAGVEKVLLGLRVYRDNVSAWYSNPDELNRIIVWTPGDDTLWGTNEELEEGTIAYRFSIVADDPFDDEERCRFGITDESAKLNINTATRQQLMRLLRQVATEEDMVVEELVDALLDWRDEDEQPRENGAEFEYYGTLDTPYHPKNGLFDTVEELLMVKGFDGRVLYGEDADRNGLLGPNEDDGDDSFPADNTDGELNRGLYPYITVISRDANSDHENRPRIDLYGEQQQVRAQLAEYIDDSRKIEFIIQAVTSEDDEGDQGGEGGAEDQGDRDEEEAPDGEDQPGTMGDGEDGGGGDDPEGLLGGGSGDQGADGGKGSRRQRARQQPIDEEDAGAEGEGEGEGEGSGEAGGDIGDALDQLTDQSSRLSSPAELLTADLGQANPLTLEDLPILMDRTTTVDPLSELEGLINVLTAPPQVLRSIPGISGEEVAAIVQNRTDLSDEERLTTAWLATREAVSVETYVQIAPYITVRGRQFTIQSLGYADHVGMIYRLQVMVEMRGPVPQVVYYRDLTSLGAVFPIREGEGEYGFGGTSG